MPEASKRGVRMQSLSFEYRAARFANTTHSYRGDSKIRS